MWSQQQQQQLMGQPPSASSSESVSGARPGQQIQISSSSLYGTVATTDGSAAVSTTSGWGWGESWPQNNSKVPSVRERTSELQQERTKAGMMTTEEQMGGGVGESSTDPMVVVPPDVDEGKNPKAQQQPANKTKRAYSAERIEAAKKAWIEAGGEACAYDSMTPTTTGAEETQRMSSEDETRVDGDGTAGNENLDPASAAAAASQQQQQPEEDASSAIESTRAEIPGKTSDLEASALLLGLSPKKQKQQQQQQQAQFLTGQGEGALSSTTASTASGNTPTAGTVATPPILQPNHDEQRTQTNSPPAASHMTNNSPSTSSSSTTRSHAAAAPPPQQQRPLPLVSPKCALNGYYGQRHRGLHLSNNCFTTWSVGKDHVKKFTSILTCPVSGEQFGCGRYGEGRHYSLGDENGDVDEVNGRVVWYAQKKPAEHGAAARAYDCLMLRENINNKGRRDGNARLVRYCIEEPYLTHSDGPTLPMPPPPVSMGVPPAMSPFLEGRTTIQGGVPIASGTDNRNGNNRQMQGEGGTKSIAQARIGGDKDTMSTEQQHQQKNDVVDPMYADAEGDLTESIIQQVVQQAQYEALRASSVPLPAPAPPAPATATGGSSPHHPLLRPDGDVAQSWLGTDIGAAATATTTSEKRASSSAAATGIK